ncbi:MAG: methionyl-tRNA formyltransferase, partial [Candidatus Kapabacteria bacterium]|nr:methionyl-tRNA formyltransferase [Candidatus Kapabacteria bacterium]MDW7996326.1 methionyl-tRNA formyltransferase [Bacteroidota bacterium]
SLEALHREFGVGLVITAPEKPQGRGLRLRPSAVKEAALRLGIPVWEPPSLRNQDFVQQFCTYAPDFLVVVAFRIVPPEVYGSVRRAAFCVHPSLLPKLRGAAPIHWAIIRGETVTGITSFLLEASVDTGAILLQRKQSIPDGATYGELHDLLMPLAAEVAVATLQGLLAGTLHPQPQDHSQATTAPKLRPEDCHLRWDRPAEEVRRWIHGLSPEPGAWALLQGRRLRFLRARTVALEQQTRPGTFLISGDHLFVACADGAVEITELQQEGRRPLPAATFLRGWRGPHTGILT